jgi:hypothetical protein
MALRVVGLKADLPYGALFTVLFCKYGENRIEMDRIYRTNRITA